MLRPLGVFSSGHAALFYRWPVEQAVQGELKFSGYDFSQAWPGDPAPNAARAVDWSNPARPKIEGEYVRPKRALVWTVYSQETKRVEVAVIEQRSLKDGIIEIIGESDDYTFTDDGIANFCLKITRKGTGLDTSYSVLPKLTKPTKAEVDAFQEVAETSQMSNYLKGKHPLRKPAAEFSSTTEAGATSEF
ncbi:hypothetical protein [Synechococcus sp. BIOS-E4-1]|uniref:hypothetical protein n=1 Tax=Synechococcus sp. BIOS-E4-1 TaxID=1400864 RepID=UPI001CA3DF4F|nr:hypothetical protein [Synechococcus sp. BIOS-E4-1]